MSLEEEALKRSYRPAGLEGESQAGTHQVHAGFGEWYRPKKSAARSPGAPSGRSERDKGERAIESGEKTRPGAPRSSPTAFQAYHRSVLLILEDAAQQLPDQYPDLVRILAKKLEREM